MTRKRGRKHRAQGEVIATILIVLVVLAASVLVWRIINQQVRERAENTDLDLASVKLEIRNAVVDSERNVHLDVRRGADSAQLSGIKLVLEGKSGATQSSFVKDVTPAMSPMSTAAYDIAGEENKMTEISKIKAVPVSKSGKSGLEAVRVPVLGRFICNAGQETCNGVFLLVCEKAGTVNKWENMGANAKCGAECTILGEWKCIGQNYYECLGYKWINWEKVNGKCGYTLPDVCIDGETSCNDKNYLVCVNKQWANYGKVVGFCGVECLGGDDCIGQEYIICENNGWVNKGFVDGKCGYSSGGYGECTDGDWHCEGYDKIVCVSGSWSNTGHSSDCGYGCGTYVTGYGDSDGDGYGAGSNYEFCDSVPSGYSYMDGDCDDWDSSVWSGPADFYVDGDYDRYGSSDYVSVCYGNDYPPWGFSSNSGDCDDWDGSAWQWGYGYVDSDYDGCGSSDYVSVCYGNNLPWGYSDNSDDCNDNDPNLCLDCSSSGGCTDGYGYCDGYGYWNECVSGYWQTGYEGCY